MHYALLSQAKRWIANAYGTNDPETLTEVINAIRREWYAWYEDTAIFVDVEECFEVQTFPLGCNRVADCYRGITLPRGWESIEAMWLNDRPVQMFDRWRQWQDGLACPCDNALAKYDMGDSFPTERDMIPGRACKLVAQALSPKDIGKRFVIRGTSFTGDPIEQAFSLETRPQVSALPFLSINQPGGIVMDLMEGRVALAQDGGRLLSVYAPGEQVPAYKRVKITGLPSGHSYVIIRGARRYVELFDDYDVVESDNSRAWESMARAIRLNRKADRDGKDMQSEKLYVTQCRELLLGDKSRSLGKSAQQRVNIVSPRFTPRHRLNGRQ